MIFDKPKDLKRHAMLTVSHKDGADEQWVYDPENNQVKRILSNNAFTPFSGTEITLRISALRISLNMTINMNVMHNWMARLCYVINRFQRQIFRLSALRDLD